jgi:(2Fe-2S) ferredoxin
MSVPTSKWTHHIFVCQTERPPAAKPSCGPRGAAAIVAAMQEELAARPELWGQVMVTPSGCLGPCFDGPTVVVYPEAVWYCGVRREDVPEIFEQHIVGGKPVERLRYTWPE